MCFQDFVCKHKVWANMWKVTESGLMSIWSGTENGSAMQDQCKKRGCRREHRYKQVQEKLGGKHESASLSHLMGLWWQLLKERARWAHEPPHTVALRLQLIPEPTSIGRNSPLQLSSPSEGVLPNVSFFPQSPMDSLCPSSTRTPNRSFLVIVFRSNFFFFASSPSNKKVGGCLTPLQIHCICFW